MAKDPVCVRESNSLKSLRFIRFILTPGMDVDEDSAKFETEYNDKIYYFCAPGSKKLFEDDPEKYLE